MLTASSSMLMMSVCKLNRFYSLIDKGLLAACSIPEFNINVENVEYLECFTKLGGLFAPLELRDIHDAALGKIGKLLLGETTKLAESPDRLAELA